MTRPHAGSHGPGSAKMGTPAYMAPERISGRRGDGRCDLYAVGLILYETLTGRLPFAGFGARAIMRVLREEPKPPTHFAPELNPDLSAVVYKAIARAAPDRYQSARIPRSAAPSRSRAGWRPGCAPGDAQVSAAEPGGASDRRRRFGDGVGVLDLAQPACRRDAFGKRHRAAGDRLAARQPWRSPLIGGDDSKV